MKLILVNNSADIFTYAASAVTVQPASSLDVPASAWFPLITDTAFIKDLVLNNLTVSDGIQSYSYPESLEYAQYINDQSNYNNRDTDGALITRNKAAKKGWTFLSMAIEITTSTIGGTLYCKDSAGNDIPGLTCKIYDANNAEITTPGVLNANLNQCVKTVLDFESGFDYEIIGGALRINANQSNDVRLWIIGAPDIPANLGGSKEFATGINLKFLAADASFEVDGRVAKFIQNDPVFHSSKLRILLKHPAGNNTNMQFVIHLYRQ